MPGYVLLYRDIDRHWVWKDGLMAHRWMDLVIQAEYRNRTMYFGGVRVDLKRGQLVTTTRLLMARWRTNARMVLKVLDIFENDKMIRCKKNNEMTIITISNFDKFQALFQEPEEAEKPTEISSISDEGGQRERKRQGKRTKEYKEDKKEKNKKTPVVESAPTHEEVFDDFFNEQNAVDVFCMQESVDLETCKTLAREVINDWILRGEVHQTLKDGKQHLLNQLRIKIKVFRQQQKREQNVLEQKRAGKKAGEVQRGMESGVGGSDEPNPLARARVYTADLSATD